MASINKVILVGHMCSDAKLAYLPSGNAVAEFSVATNEKFKDREGNQKETTEFHRVKVFGKAAEFCGNYLGKGRLVYVEGSNKTRSWDDQQGQKRYMTEVVVSAPSHCVQALDRGPDQGQQQSAPQQRPAQQPQPQRQNSFPSESSGMDAMPGSDNSDVPFALFLAPLAALAMAAMQIGWLA